MFHEYESRVSSLKSKQKDRHEIRLSCDRTGRHTVTQQNNWNITDVPSDAAGTLGFFSPPTTHLPSLLNLNASYFLVFCFRNLLKLQFTRTRQGLEKPSFPLRHVVPPHSSSGPTPSPPVPGSPYVPPFPSSTHQNPRNRKTVHAKKGFGTNTETQEVSRSVLSSSVFLVPKLVAFTEVQQPCLGQSKCPLQKAASPEQEARSYLREFCHSFPHTTSFCVPKEHSSTTQQQPSILCPDRHIKRYTKIPPKSHFASFEQLFINRSLPNLCSADS